MTHKDQQDKREYFLYTGRKTNEISFPLGGIGTGCIGLAGNGRLIDWEIFNKPNKGSFNGYSHFAIKAESDGKVLDARALHGDLLPPYTGTGNTQFGFGPVREYLAGLPHFEEVEFRGEYPIAKLDFKGTESFPGSVSLTGFNPFIPLNDKDSGIPGAFFEIEVSNSTDKKITYTLAGTLNNPLPENNINEIEQADGFTLLHLTSDGPKPEDVSYGDLTLATDAPNVSWQKYWIEDGWFDYPEIYWRNFTAPGEFKTNYISVEETGKNRPGLLLVNFDLEAGESRVVRFVITWNFPNCENYWAEKKCDCACDCSPSKTWKNYYATLWKDSGDSAKYSLQNWDRLLDETLLFKDSLFASDLPPATLDAVSANISILKSPTVMRLGDGTFYGWEGCRSGSGCCEGSCTHVWNYAQALPFLFPKLERSMREADYKYNLHSDGGMSFRIQLPIGSGQWEHRACADGQFGGVMKVYRDWKIYGDTEWLRTLWPSVKKSIEFAWQPSNEDKWDLGKTGVLHGRQHHTLDVELFGPNSWLTGFYLGALRAGAEMAEVLGEHDTAAEYSEIFKRGKKWVDDNLFNGEYYCQKIDLKDRSMLEQFTGAVDFYWSDRQGELKYQIAEGSGIDQILAQWHATLYDLGDIFDPDQAKKAAQSMFKYNFHPKMRDFFNSCRIYCLNDEGGLVIAHWPKHVYRPMIPLTYAGEAMNGFEYAAAGTMIQMGLVEEGITCIEALRNRYDGERRNPWNEFECGSNYARSMASYALLNTFAGFRFDMSKGMVGFNPIISDGPFRCFWSLDSGWGNFKRTEKSLEFEVVYGSIELNTFQSSCLEDRVVRSVTVAGKEVEFKVEENKIVFAKPAIIVAGQTLQIDMPS